ncbi:MAG: hypothetical protein JWQ98_702 [Chlorobi bacterium]|nr:hypothetical protein [Chlorobiota bacterium]
MCWFYARLGLAWPTVAGEETGECIQKIGLFDILMIM